MSRDVLKAVTAAIYNATANGFHFAGWTDAQVAADLHIYSSDLEKYDFREIKAAVGQVRSA